MATHAYTTRRALVRAVALVPAVVALPAIASTTDLPPKWQALVRRMQWIDPRDVLGPLVVRRAYLMGADIEELACINHAGRRANRRRPSLVFGDWPHGNWREIGADFVAEYRVEPRFAGPVVTGDRP